MHPRAEVQVPLALNAFFTCNQKFSMSKISQPSNIWSEPKSRAVGHLEALGANIDSLNVKAPQGKYIGFSPVGSATEGSETWQVPGLIPHAGVLIVLAPPGAASAAMVDYFGALMSGKTVTPFGAARHSGDVLIFSTYLAQNDFLNRDAAWFQASTGRIYSRRTERRFNWRNPLKDIKETLGTAEPGAISAVIIAAGPLSKSVDDSIVESAHVNLARIAEAKCCVIIIVAETNSKARDPFERIPPSLRAMHDTLLVCSLTSKNLDPQAQHLPKFVLLRLSQKTTAAVSVRFTLSSKLDYEGTCIHWEAPQVAEPREVLRHAETDDVSGAQRVAAEFAYRIICEWVRLQRGLPSSIQLQALGLQNGIAKSTMKEALTAAHACGRLELYRTHSGGKVWGLPSPKSHLANFTLGPSPSGLFRY